MQVENPALMQQLKENIKLFRSLLTKNLTGAMVIGSPDSPILHLKPSTQQPRETMEKALQEVVDYAYREGVLCTRAKYCTSQEMILPSPSIRVVLSAGFTKKEIERCASVLKEGFKRFK